MFAIFVHLGAPDSHSWKDFLQFWPFPPFSTFLFSPYAVMQQLWAIIRMNGVIHRSASISSVAAAAYLGKLLALRFVSDHCMWHVSAIVTHLPPSIPFFPWQKANSGIWTIFLIAAPSLHGRFRGSVGTKRAFRNAERAFVGT